MPLIKFKGMKVLKKRDNIIKIVNMSRLNIKYGHFIFAMKGQDNMKKKEDNSLFNKQNSLVVNNSLNIVEDKYSSMKLYTNGENNKNKYYKIIKYLGKNIKEEKY